MRRPTSIAVVLAALAFFAAQTAPSAHGYKIYSSSHRFFELNAADPGGVSIILNVEYAKRTPKGKSTPRKVYLQFRAPVSCQTGGSTSAFAASGPFKFKHQVVEFSGSFPSQFAPSSNPAPGSSSTNYVTGHLIKKKNKKKWRMEGTAAVLSYDSPPAFLGCSSGEFPYSAPRCTWSAPTKGSAPPCTDIYPRQ